MLFHWKDDPYYTIYLPLEYNIKGLIHNNRRPFRVEFNSIDFEDYYSLSLDNREKQIHNIYLSLEKDN